MNYISENLKKARKSLGWSQEQTAKALGIKRATLASYEEGRATPSIKLLPRLTQVFVIRDWQAFLADPDFDINNQKVPGPSPSLMEERYAALDQKHKNLVDQLLNLP